jgi:uncharacterized protein (DUF433 family)
VPSWDDALRRTIVKRVAMAFRRITPDPRVPSRAPCIRRLRVPGATVVAMAFTRIKIDHQIMGGLPRITGTRIPVAMLARMVPVATGTPIDTLLEEYPQLHEEDAREALRFAAANVDQRVVPLDQTARDS